MSEKSWTASLSKGQIVLLIISILIFVGVGVLVLVLLILSNPKTSTGSASKSASSSASKTGTQTTTATETATATIASSVTYLGANNGFGSPAVDFGGQLFQGSFVSMLQTDNFVTWSTATSFKTAIVNNGGPPYTEITFEPGTYALTISATTQDQVGTFEIDALQADSLQSVFSFPYTITGGDAASHDPDQPYAFIAISGAPVTLTFLSHMAISSGLIKIYSTM